MFYISMSMWGIRRVESLDLTFASVLPSIKQVGNVLPPPLPPSLPLSFTLSLPYSLTLSLPYSLTLSLPYSLPLSLSLSLPPSPHTPLGSNVWSHHCGV